MVRFAFLSLTLISFLSPATASDAPSGIIATDDVPAITPEIVSRLPVQHLRGPQISDGGPPPGTIGMTYQLPSRPVPLDEHPRIGMLVVRTRSPIIHMHVDHMGGFRRNDGNWQFKTDRPLIPGVPSIVAVESRASGDHADPIGVRFVRLIPGRVVYLDF